MSKPRYKQLDPFVDCEAVDCTRRAVVLCPACLKLFVLDVVEAALLEAVRQATDDAIPDEEG